MSDVIGFKEVGKYIGDKLRGVIGKGENLHPYDQMVKEGQKIHKMQGPPSDDIVDDLNKLKNPLDIQKNIKTGEEYYLRGLGLSYITNGEFKKALDSFNKAIKINPQGAYSYCHRGRAKAYIKDFDGAMEDFNRAIELDDKYADAYTNRGLLKSKLLETDITPEDIDKLKISERKELFSEAMADINKAIELDPKDIEALRQRGLIKMAWKDHDGAITDFKKALNIKPDKSHWQLHPKEIAELEDCIVLAQADKEGRNVIVDDNPENPAGARVRGIV